MRNLDELLDEAKWGKLTDKKIDYMVQSTKTSKPDNDEDLYTLIHILGKAEAKQHKKLIENFLHYPTDPMISKIALQTLCNFWNYHSDYLNEIKQLIRGVGWDDDQQIRIIAISAAENFLNHSRDKELEGV